MMKNADITIFNTRIGADRRESYCPIRISGVFWYETKAQASSGTDRTGSAKYIIRIPESVATVPERMYISEEKYKKLPDDEAERYWTIQKGTYVIKGQPEDLENQIDGNEMQRLLSLHGDFVTITEYADNTVRGTTATRHWRIGGS